MKINDTVLVPMKIVGIDPRDPIFRYEVDTSFAFAGTGTMWIKGDAPVTLQPAGDAELLERAVKVLEDIRNRLQLCYGDERDTAAEQRIDEFLAEARREVE